MIEVFASLAEGRRGPLLAAQATPVTIPTAGGGSVAVITREGWGCDERLRTRGKTETWPEMYVPAKRVLRHHTATSSSHSDAAAEVRAIYTYHTRTLG